RHQLGAGALRRRVRGARARRPVSDQRHGPRPPGRRGRRGGLVSPEAGVTLTIDGKEVTVPRGTLIIRAAEQPGIQIPRFWDHPLEYGPGESRFTEAKRVFPKPVTLSPLVNLDRERCILCARCTRFCDEISGDRFIELFARGAGERVSIAAGEDFRSPFSGNTVQICPVGALTSTPYRFVARPFDLSSVDTVFPHCS